MVCGDGEILKVPCTVEKDDDEEHKLLTTMPELWEKLVFTSKVSYSISKNIYSTMDSSGARVFSYEDLKGFTDDFSVYNLIAEFQFGRVYRGIIGLQVVTVKIWEDINAVYDYNPFDNERRLSEEVVLLNIPEIKSHPNIVKLIGHCWEGEKLGMVYNLKSLDTIHNLTLEDGFTWLSRIKVAFVLAHVLKFLHSQKPRYLVRNLSANHIMVDENFNPILYEFAMIYGGVFPERVEVLYKVWVFGYIDTKTTWSYDKCRDVFAFGIILLSLISKKRALEEEHKLSYDESEVDQEKSEASEEEKESKGNLFYEISLVNWAMEINKLTKSRFGRLKCSLVHTSLEREGGYYLGDGPKLTWLAMRCLDSDLNLRPTMKEVVNYMRKLHVVRTMQPLDPSSCFF